MCSYVPRQFTHQTRVEGHLHSTTDRRESRTHVKRHRIGMIERTGVHMEALDWPAPRADDGLIHEPSPDTLPHLLFYETEERKLAALSLAKVEFQQPNVSTIKTHHIRFDLWIANDRAQRAIVHAQTGEPEPLRTHGTVNRLVPRVVGGAESLERMPGRMIALTVWRRRRGHLEVRHDARHVSLGHG